MRALALFGHFCLVVGCYLVAWGINLLPVSSPEPLDILTKPLFWGFNLHTRRGMRKHAFKVQMHQRRMAHNEEKWRWTEAALLTSLHLYFYV